MIDEKILKNRDFGVFVSKKETNQHSEILAQKWLWIEIFSFWL